MKNVGKHLGLVVDFEGRTVNRVSLYHRYQKFSFPQEIYTLIHSYILIENKNNDRGTETGIIF